MSENDKVENKEVTQQTNKPKENKFNNKNKKVKENKPLKFRPFEILSKLQDNI